MLNAMQMDNLPVIGEVINSPQGKSITPAENYCGYSGPARDIMSNWVHPVFFEAKTAASKVDDPNWRQDKNCTFYYEY